jgi:hypothetical protein
MGYDSWFFARADYADINKRMENQEMEFVWRPNSQSLGNDTQILTHILYGPLYGPPDGFNWDVLSDDAPWINDENSRDFNADSEAEKLDIHLRERVKHYKTDEIFILFGFDFQYMNAQYNYQNMDNMISYMNEHYADKYHFKYSTPGTYTDALKKHNVAWPTKYDDMFPYSDNPDGYWTGYFSSRPNHKAYIRRASHNLHASFQLYAE